MSIQLTTFEWVPPFAQGFVRDLAVRWALAEANIPYSIRLINFSDAATDAYRHKQPFGQVPVLEENGLTLFESGSILLYLGKKSELLLPKDLAESSRAQTWVFAALNSIDPLVQYFNDVNSLSEKEDWARSHRITVLNKLKKRLFSLEHWLQGRVYLEDRFTIGDIMMTLILRNLIHSNVLTEFSNVDEYRKRNEGREAFKIALSAQLQTFADHPPRSGT